MHEYMERNTHTEQHQMESAAWAGPGSHYSLTHTEGLVGYVMQAVQGDAGLANHPPQGTQEVVPPSPRGYLHPLPALRGSRSLSAVSALG